MLRCVSSLRTPMDEALFAAGRLANPHGQAVFFEKNPRSSQGVANSGTRAATASLAGNCRRPLVFWVAA
jgi:hypothetical protein